MPITRRDVTGAAADRPARRGESVAAEVLQAMRVDDRAVRAAMSRLARDGWFAREKIGRLSFYSLTPSAKREFAVASGRIYGAPAPADGTHWRLVILPAGEGRGGRRDRLLKAGYGQVAPGVLVGPVHLGLPDEAADGTVLTATVEAGEPGALVASAFDLAPLTRRYGAFVERYAPLQNVLASEAVPDDLTALIARTLLIHDYRRVALRDPGLPPLLLPRDWAGHDARRLCASLYRRLAGPSDEWLSRHGRRRDGALPPPTAAYHDRFNAL